MKYSNTHFEKRFLKSQYIEGFFPFLLGWRRFTTVSTIWKGIMDRIVFNDPSSPLGIEKEAGGLICSKRKYSFS